MKKDKQDIIRWLDDLVINSRTWSFWEDVTIQDIDLSDSWEWNLLITKGWDSMTPYDIPIVVSDDWEVSFLKSEKELTKEFRKIYGE